MGIVRIQIRDLFVMSSSIYLVIILLCFGMAVFHERNSPMFPLVSYSIVSSPELYIYRIGMILSSSFILIKSFFLFVYFSNERFKGFQILDRISFFCGICISLSCAVMAGVSKDESFIAHAGSTFMFYTSIQGYILLCCLRLFYILWRAQQRPFTNKSFCFKFAISFLSFCCYSLFVLFCCNFGKYYYLVGVMEWIMYVAFILFVVSFAFDFSDHYVMEIILSNLEEKKTPPTASYVVDQLTSRKNEP